METACASSCELYMPSCTGVADRGLCVDLALPDAIGADAWQGTLADCRCLSRMRLDVALAFGKTLRRYHVYAICDADRQPVYVGMTLYPERRYRQHRSSRSHHPALRDWIIRNMYAHTFEVLDSYMTSKEMREAEREYIQYLMPQFNRAMQCW